MLPIEMSLQRIKSRTPERSKILGPCMDFLEWLDPDLIKPVATFTAFGDKVSVLQNLEMLRNGRERNPKRPGEFAGWAFAAFEGLKHPAPRGVGDGVEDVVFL